MDEDDEDDDDEEDGEPWSAAGRRSDGSNCSIETPSAMDLKGGIAADDLGREEEEEEEEEEEGAGDRDEDADEADEKVGAALAAAGFFFENMARPLLLLDLAVDATAPGLGRF